MKLRTSQYQTATYLVIIGAVAIRHLISPHFMLVPDEANYWQWSRYLDLGYHDHPPMIAWTIWLSTKLFGHTEFAVRFPTIIGSGLFSLYLSLLAARFFSWQCAFHTCLITQCILLINGSALIATPDGLLLPCWAAAVYHGARAVNERTARQWLLTGLWFGLGMLSKYTMLVFLPCFFFAILARKEYRTSLISPLPWTGLGLSFLLFTPVLLWNSRNDWSTFRHVLYQGGVENKDFFTLRYLGDFFGSQLMLLTPVLFFLILAVWFTRIHRRTLPDAKVSYLVWMSLPGFLVFLLLSFHVRIYGNWPAPVYTTALVLVAAVFSPRREEGANSMLLWKSALITAILITLPVVIQVVYPALPLSIKLDRTARETAGWDQLGSKIGEAIPEMKRPESTFIFGLRYQEASELAFYVPGQPRTLSINKWARPNVYDYWTEDEQVIGMDAIGVFEYKPMESLIAELFAHSDPVETIVLTRHSPWFGTQEVQTLYIFRGYGFKGGLRWQPKDTHDIRAVSQ